MALINRFAAFLHGLAAARPKDLQRIRTIYEFDPPVFGWDYRVEIVVPGDRAGEVGQYYADLSATIDAFLDNETRWNEIEMMVSIHAITADGEIVGEEDGASASYAGISEAAIGQAAGTLKEWAVRYKDTVADKINIWFRL